MTDVVTFGLEGTPPSLNKVGGSGAWQQWNRHKKRWQADVETMLMVLTAEGRFPRRVDHVGAAVTMRFPTRRRRDTGNFQALLEKAIGDALVGHPKVWPDGRWLADDTPDQYSFTALEFELEPGPPRTTITFDYRPVA